MSLAVVGGLVVGMFLKGGNRKENAVGGAATERQQPVRVTGMGRDSRPLGNSTFSSQLSLEARNELQSLEDIASRDSLLALSRLSAIEDSNLRSLALAAIARGWAKSDPQAAGAWVAQLESETDAISAALGLIPAWADSSPNNCLAWTTGLDSGKLREISLAQLADAWVSIDPQEALSRYFTLSSEPGSEQGLHVIVAQWALDAPQAAVDYLTRAKDLPRREEFLETALVSLSNQDPVLAWNDAGTSGLTDPERIRNVRAMALESMSESNPLDAIKLAESVGNDPELLKGIARGWAFKDAAAATEWIHAMKDPELETSLLDEISRK